MDEKDLELSVAKALELFEARQAAKAAKEAELEAEVNKRLDAKVKAIEIEAEAKAKAWQEQKGSANVMEKAKKGSGGEKGDVDTLVYYMKTGDMVAAKASLGVVDGDIGQGVDAGSRKALSEGTVTAGGVVVPDDVILRIIAKRDKLSFVRQMGVQVINTDRDKVDVPAEGTSLTKFDRTAESGTYSTNDPAFVQNTVTVEKWTKVTRITEELLDDDQNNLLGWYVDALSRAMAQTEAYYVAIGNGTNQHEGIFEGGDTNALTFDSSGNITADELPELYYKLNSGYRAGNVCWLMDTVTWNYVLTIASANRFQLNPNMAMIDFGDSGAKVGSLLGKPVYCQDDIPEMSTGNCVIMVGDPWYYALVERRGLTISRNPYLYQASGQIGFFNTFRQGGKVLVEEAWVGALMA